MLQYLFLLGEGFFQLNVKGLTQITSPGISNPITTDNIHATSLIIKGDTLFFHK